MANIATSIIVVTLNPAIDRIYEVPGFEVGQHQRGQLVSIQPAGKGANVSRILSILGSRCTLTGFVG
ncbi:MAG: 1-phosphofructokinase, partial [Phycisphaerae bacterium]|nr:1-phosphofructokinase [Phycisphaerae bacterium]